VCDKIKQIFITKISLFWDIIIFKFFVFFNGAKVFVQGQTFLQKPMNKCAYIFMLLNLNRFWILHKKNSFAIRKSPDPCEIRSWIHGPH